MAQLICHHLSVGYDSKAVLTDLNFEVNEQDYLCIVGENGAGKSTLMKTCGLRPFYNTQEKELAEDAMERMQITDLARRCYRELSGGQQQRVLLARALCATQKMLLVDEPVSGLDPKATAQMYELLEELNEIDGITIIMISHDIAAAMKYASHILRVGKHTFFGTKDEYLEEYRRRKAYRRMIQKREAQKEEGEWQ